MTGRGSQEIKNCCAAAYGHDAVALLLGASYHPGGQAMTERLADALDLRAGQPVVDIASGTGATARLLAGQRGVRVAGVELNADTANRAHAATEEAGLSELVRFHTGDAEHLPFPDGEFDAVVCECAFCTFPNKATAAAEFARVLRPGGKVGITDVTVHSAGVPTELTGLAGWVACIADARSLEDYIAILDAAGLRTTCTQRHGEALRSMIDTLEARLKLLRMTAPERLASAGVDVAAVLRYSHLAAEAAASGTLGYVLVTATKPLDSPEM